MAKGEIACFEQFLLFSLCFQKAAEAAEVSESVYMRERVKISVSGKGPTLFHIQVPSDASAEDNLGKHCDKRRHWSS